jgi:ADP-heptose:LPS heptosyltransferase
MSGMPDIALCLANNSSEAMPSFDTYCPMLSLPFVLGTRLDSIPANVPYLPLPAVERIQAWDSRLPSRGRLRVGLVWSGNPDQSNDRHRSIKLRTLARIIDVDATFVSLQKDLRLADKSLLAQTDIIDLTGDLTNFSETAALVSCLDLVITVCTSVAHLAGALGRPTWVLLSRTADYRWLLDRDDSPWYPTVRLFRQSATREYDSVVERARTALLDLIARHP